MMSELIYLATPYSHPESEVMERRFLMVSRVAADLMRDGRHVFSPISHTHPIALAGDLPRGWDYWERYDRLMLGACGKVVVLKQDGWDVSSGVKAEVKLALELGIPVEYMECPYE